MTTITSSVHLSRKAADRWLEHDGFQKLGRGAWLKQSWLSFSGTGQTDVHARVTQVGGTFLTLANSSLSELRRYAKLVRAIHNEPNTQRASGDAAWECEADQAEQSFERRAAFGSGVEVINVMTGQRYHT